MFSYVGMPRKRIAKTPARRKTRTATKRSNRKSGALFYFGKSRTDGDGSMKELLGGKGANLAEMTTIGLPVPPGFTITTETCKRYNDGGGKMPAGVMSEVKQAVAWLEAETGKRFGDTNNPLLVSVRSGAAASMPGMMDTVLNLGLNDKAVVGLAKLTGVERFAWDAYRRLINMFGDVVMGIEHSHFEEAFKRIKKRYKAETDTDVPAEGMRELCEQYKKVYQRHVRSPFPQDPLRQLELSIEAVFKSWMTPRAVRYRQINEITGLPGTAVNIQSMVFGNMGDDCGTGVAFQLLSALASRLPAKASTQDAILDLARHSIAYAAMATICDCVPLIGENRILARTGLIALADAKHPGIKALLRIASVSRDVQSDDISFRLGPRINAAGRMGVADRALKLLLTQDEQEARKLAKELDSRNSERQQLEAKIVASARQQVLDSSSADDPIIVLADQGWHAGVVGIVAARLMTEFQKPAVLIALNGDRGRGSGRSVPEFDLHQALSGCAGYLEAFGGHAAAAGLEIRTDQVAAFRTALIREAQKNQGPEPDRRILIDAEIPLGLLTPSLMNELNRIAPFGEGLPPPLLVATDLSLSGAPRQVGKNQSHLSFAVSQGSVTRKAIAFGMAHCADRLREAESVSLAFTPRLNLFRGQASVDLDIRDIHTNEET